MVPRSAPLPLLPVRSGPSTDAPLSALDEGRTPVVYGSEADVQESIIAVVWGGTQITWLRAGLALGGEALVVAYLLWVVRSLGR
jgi:hypothetical protein